MGLMARVRALESATPNTNSVAGTVQANKSVVVDGNKDASSFRNLTAVTLKAGASGVAGGVEVFPGTAAKGKTTLAMADNAGNTTTAIAVAAQAGARTLTVPDPGASASFVMTEGAVTLNGVRTFGSMPVLPRTTVAATGSVLADAAQLTASVCKVTAADGTKGVKLPAVPAAGSFILIRNASASALKVWPDAAATINAIAANAAISMAANTSALFWADSTTQWYTLPLVPS